jgi:hypothetical protein
MKFGFSASLLIGGYLFKCGGKDRILECSTQEVYRRKEDFLNGVFHTHLGSS